MNVPLGALPPFLQVLNNAVAYWVDIRVHVDQFNEPFEKLARILEIQILLEKILQTSKLLHEDCEQKVGELLGTLTQNFPDLLNNGIPQAGSQINNVDPVQLHGQMAGNECLALVNAMKCLKVIVEELKRSRDQKKSWWGAIQETYKSRNNIQGTSERLVEALHFLKVVLQLLEANSLAHFRWVNPDAATFWLLNYQERDRVEYALVIENLLDQVGHGKVDLLFGDLKIRLNKCVSGMVSRKVFDDNWPEVKEKIDLELSKPSLFLKSNMPKRFTDGKEDKELVPLSFFPVFSQGEEEYAAKVCAVLQYAGIRVHWDSFYCDSDEDRLKLLESISFCICLLFITRKFLDESCVAAKNCAKRNKFALICIIKSMSPSVHEEVCELFQPSEIVEQAHHFVDQASICLARCFEKYFQGLHIRSLEQLVHGFPIQETNFVRFDAKIPQLLSRKMFDLTTAELDQFVMELSFNFQGGEAIDVIDQVSHVVHQILQPGNYFRLLAVEPGSIKVSFLSRSKIFWIMMLQLSHNKVFPYFSKQGVAERVRVIHFDFYHVKKVEWEGKECNGVLIHPDLLSTDFKISYEESTDVAASPRSWVDACDDCLDLTNGSSPFILDSGELLEALDTQFRLFETLFFCVEDRALNLMIQGWKCDLLFYYGYSSALYLHLLKQHLGSFILERFSRRIVNPFLSILENRKFFTVEPTGTFVDFQRPSVQDLRSFRNQVHELASDVIHNNLLHRSGKKIQISSKMWTTLIKAISIGIEYERIILEKCVTLVRQIPLNMIREESKLSDSGWSNSVYAHWKSDIAGVPRNEMVDVSVDEMYVDSSCGPISVSSFKISKQLVTNAEWLEFVNDGGYEKQELWSPEGWAWVYNNRPKHAKFWIPKEDTYVLRNTNSETASMPWDWPAEVNAFEAVAFCSWMTAKSGVRYRLPNDHEWDLAMLKLFPSGKMEVNKCYYSCTPVDFNPTGEVYDACGNVWQWTMTSTIPLDSHQTIGLHQHVLKGGSWVSQIGKKEICLSTCILPPDGNFAGFRYIQEMNE